MKVGDFVKHNGHGEGKIIAMNSNGPMSSGLKYTLDHIGEMPQKVIQLISVNAFYPGDQYPFVVSFLDGYTDVYNEHELKLL